MGKHGKNMEQSTIDMQGLQLLHQVKWGLKDDFEHLDYAGTIWFASVLDFAGAGWCTEGTVANFDPFSVAPVDTGGHFGAEVRIAGE